MFNNRQIDENSAGPGMVPDAARFLSLVVPAYNEAFRIGRSLDRIKAYLTAKPLLET